MFAALLRKLKQINAKVSWHCQEEVSRNSSKLDRCSETPESKYSGGRL